MISKAGYWLGGGLIVLAAVGAILWAVLSGAQAFETVDDFQRVNVPGRSTVHLRARKYVLYAEGPGADEAPPAVQIAVLDPRTERPLSIAPYGATVTYSFHTTGSAVATVTPPSEGDYVLSARGLSEGSGYSVAVGDSIAGRIVRVVVGAFAIGGVLFVAGAAMIVVTAVRRSRRRGDPPPQSWPPPVGAA